MVGRFQIHWPGNCSSFEQCVAALHAAQVSGKILHYGLCNFGTTDLAKFLEAGGKPISNQVPYNLLWRAIEHGIAPASIAAGLAILPYSPLQQGLLAGKAHTPADVPDGRRRTRLYRSDSSSKTRHGALGVEQLVFDKDTGALSQLRQLAGQADIALPSLALGWLLSRPGVGCVLVGASSPKQVERNAVMPEIDSQVVVFSCTL